MPLNILVTGGAGFIGSHTCIALAKAGMRPMVLDNLCNSDGSALTRVARIVGDTTVPFWRGDVRDPVLLDRIFRQHDVHAVVHFAGLKSVGDSVARPLDYYDCNVEGSLTLVSAMQRARVRRLIFSSSATVYGQPDASPVNEAAPLRPCSPYGRSKLMVEQMLGDVAGAEAGWRIACLRYFNPAGAHESGWLGEESRGTPSNLMPVLCKVARRELSCLNVHGADYPTPDGTCIRDYVHVMDVAEGHVAALRSLDEVRGAQAINLGVGRGASVLELLEAFRRASGLQIDHRLGPRRPGDAPAYWADVGLARRMFGWTARRSIDDICTDAWRWLQHCIHERAPAPPAVAALREQLAA